MIEANQVRAISITADLKWRIFLQKFLKKISHINLTSSIGSIKLAYTRTRVFKPDIIFFDVEHFSIEEIKKYSEKFGHIPMYVIGGSSDKDSENVMEVLQSGALNVVYKNNINENNNVEKEFKLSLNTIIGLIKNRRILSNINSRNGKSIKKEDGLSFQNKISNKIKKQKIDVNKNLKIEVLVIGASTGGPHALNVLLPQLSKELKMPILLIQHLPPNLTNSFVKLLNSKTKLDIQESIDEEVLKDNVIYVAPGGKNLSVIRSNMAEPAIKLLESPNDNNIRPSLDILLESVVSVYGANVLAVILTGMGADGLNGVKLLKEKGGYCITQSKETCTVYGMPRMINEAGLANETIDLESIADRIIYLITKYKV